MKQKFTLPPTGSYRIDRIFPFPVGRITRKSGTKDHDLFVRLNNCLDVLSDRQDWDTLIAIRDGLVKPLAVLNGFEEGTLQKKDWVQTELNLMDSMNKWLDENRDLAPRTIKDYRNRIKQLLKVHPNSSVADLPYVLQDYRKHCQDQETYVSFNRTRAICLSFAKTITGKKKGSELYKDIQNVEQFPRKKVRPQLKNKPFTPRELDSLFKTAPDNVVEYRHWIWFLCLTGMGPKEFLEDGWEDHGTYLRIFGQKRVSRDRMVPLILRPPKGTPPTYDVLLRVFKSLGDRDPYDARRTYAVWLDEAGISRRHIKAYMGHDATQDMTELYTHRDVLEWIGEDTPKLQEWVNKARMESPPRPELPMKVAESVDELGDSVHAEGWDHLTDLLNNILLNWYESNFTRRLFEVGQLLDVTDSVEVTSD